GPHFGVGQPRGRLGHDAARVVAPFAPLPAAQLFDRIGRRLARDGRIATPHPLTIETVTAGAGDHPPLRRPDLIEGRRGGGRLARVRDGQGRIPGGDRPLVAV